MGGGRRRSVRRPVGVKVRYVFADRKRERKKYGFSRDRCEIPEVFLPATDLLSSEGWGGRPDMDEGIAMASNYTCTRCFHICRGGLDWFSFLMYVCVGFLLGFLYGTHV